jgi:5-methylcytosine-specific restriction protein A
MAALGPVKPCAVPGCAALLAPGEAYCVVHRPAIRRAADAGRRGSQRARGYTWAWEKRRKLFLQLYPLCGMRPGGRPPVMSACHAGGRVTPATQVDHVVPHKGDQALFWDELGNWQALCASCGWKKTAAGL